MYRNGTGVAQDNTEYAKWSLAAAHQGHVNAQQNIAVLYYTGVGIAQDLKEHMRWTLKAAHQGHPQAQCVLGSKYFTGKDVPQDYKEALRWTQKAADQGNADGQYLLSFMFLYGEGVSQSNKTAMLWGKKAADQRHARAQKIVDTLTSGVLGETPDSNGATRSNMDSTHMCACCGRGREGGLKLKPCSQCKVAVYCGEECQRKHWKDGHKSNCRPKN